MRAAENEAPSGSGGRGRRRRQSRGDVKEAAILECAWTLLATKPVADITIEEIAAGAGISRPTFYFYFESRDAVIKSLGEQVVGELIDTVSTSLGTRDSAPETVIRAMTAAYMQRWRRQGPILRAMAPLYESDPEHRAFWDKVSGRIADTMAASIEAERARGRALPGPPAARDLARALIALLWRSGYELSLTPASKRADAKVVDTVATICLRAIYGDRAVS
jgi:AcrR family transcriptional regulator